MKPKWAYHIRVFRPEVTGYPIITHTFYGRTRREAHQYAAEHMAADAFYRGCVTQGRYDAADCWADSSWQRLA